MKRTTTTHRIPSFEEAVRSILAGDDNPAEILKANVRSEDARKRGKHEFNAQPYENAHGKAPRGRGSWGFIPADADQHDVNSVVFAPGSLTYTDAKRWVRANLPAGEYNVAS